MKQTIHYLPTTLFQMKNPPFPGKLFGQDSLGKTNAQVGRKTRYRHERKRAEIISTVFNHCCGDNLLCLPQSLLLTGS